MVDKIPIAIVRGDGIGPEIMDATLLILEKSQAPIEIFPIEIGGKYFNTNNKTGIDEKAIRLIQNTKALLKAPITTPQSGGFKSLNVMLRSIFGLYANVRPCPTYWPFISTNHPSMNVVIVRENEEDLYCGIEYRQTANVFHAKKIISQLGTEKIIRYAFDYALSNNRKKVSCFTKDNILKLTDGFFHETFNTIAKEYPQIKHDHFIVDIGSALLADTPEVFDVIVMPNLYGDILSDVAAQIAGSIGIGSSANIGENFALFEAVHGSWPSGAGKDIANPSGLLLAAVEMLNYLQLHESASLIHNAWLSTIEEGIHTADLFHERNSIKKVGTKAFAQAVIDRIGKKPYQLKPSCGKTVASKKSFSIPNTPDRKFVGCDVYVYFSGNTLDLQSKTSFSDNFTLDLITNRGATFWPATSLSSNKTDEWRLRFLFTKEKYSLDILLEFLKNLQLDVIAIENLYTFDGEKGYSS